ncbi:opacity family porin, partial [Chromobacterium sp. ASV23]|uniref:opacity family porin n=1 Tax=Chromobacterium sp. ASV23 TaxID=2795110 RepID=UPI001E6064A3
SKSYKSGALGVFTEYNFVNNSNFVPYVGASTQIISADYSGDKNEFSTHSIDHTGLNIKMKLGGKYFINKNVAFTAEMSHSISTHNVHISGSDLKKSATKFEIGTRYYF